MNHSPSTETVTTRQCSHCREHKPFMAEWFRLEKFVGSKPLWAEQLCQDCAAALLLARWRK